MTIASPGSSELEFQMRAERTPNPDSVKWILSRTLLETGQSAHFEAPPAAGISPLASRLFAVEGVADGRVVVSVDSLVQAFPLSGRGPVVSFP